MKIKLDRRNILLNRIAEIKTPDQWVMVTSWDVAHKPVNYLVNPKAGYAFADFLISFEYDIDVQWVTVYDAHLYEAGHTYFVMYIEDEDGFQTFHAIPMFSDMAIRLNELFIQQNIAMNKMKQREEVTEEEHELVWNLQVIDNCFATRTDRNVPERMRIRNITVGSVTRQHGRSHLLFTQSIAGMSYPFAYVPFGKYQQLPSELAQFEQQGKSFILTDFEANNILKHIKYPII